MNEWRLAKDELPEAFESVLVCNHERDHMAVMFRTDTEDPWSFPDGQVFDWIWVSPTPFGNIIPLNGQTEWDDDGLFRPDQIAFWKPLPNYPNVRVPKGTEQ